MTLTPDEIEAERERFEAHMTAKYGNVGFGRDANGAYRPWINENWQGWLSAIASERARVAAMSARNDYAAIGVQFVSLDKKREEFDRLVEECRREESEAESLLKMQGWPEMEHRREKWEGGE